MPAITDARRMLPQAHFTWVVEEAFAPLVRLHPAVNEVIPVSARRWRRAALRPRTWLEIGELIARLRQREYQDIIDAQGLLFKSALIARFARGRRHGYDSASVRERPASWFYHERHRVPRNQHAIARNRMLTALALGYPPGSGLDFGLDRDLLRDQSKSFSGVLLHSTARPEKEWPLPMWIELARALAERGKSLTLPWGSAAERHRSISIAAGVAGAVVPPWQQLDMVARRIASASFAIGVDTGVLHLAAALRVPLVGIFVGSNPALTRPMGEGAIAVVGGENSVPTVAEVMAALDRVL
jgi:heptosyltransferase-1